MKKQTVIMRSAGSGDKLRSKKEALSDKYSGQPAAVEVTRYIKKEVERELWARAAGRCQFNGCNRPLYKSPVTQERVNISEKAHIYSFSPEGPRGWGPFITNGASINDIDNLMLLCHDCHKTIDQDKSGNRYSAVLLKKWKQEHEIRVWISSGVTSDKKSHVIFYGSNIGEQKSIVTKNDAFQAMFPNRYPASETPIVLSMTSSHEDKSEEFWKIESTHLKKMFTREILSRIEENKTVHFSVFALAPMPLLIQLGALLTDKIEVDVYQPIREPKTWEWQDFPEGFEFIVRSPQNYSNPPVLIISLSASIAHDRIKTTIDSSSIWEITVDDQFRHNDFIRSPAQLSLFRQAMRKLISDIKEKHSIEQELLIFPAMPVSCAVELGRIRMPKADMPWIIYDQNNNVGGFVKALTIFSGSADQ